jgi:Ca-activated chloride channel homolog
MTSDGAEFEPREVPVAMTRSRAACDTIQPNCVEVPMARGGSVGAASDSSTIRPRFDPDRAGRFTFYPVHTSLCLRNSFVVLVATLLLAACVGLPVLAQNEQSDIHVVPREQKKDAKPDPTVMSPAVAAEAKAAGVSVDPSLKTHTKPIRKDVDLVLVPVTVTDPMNRLVTGLEKDNFLLTDSGQPQEIKHFSSEDAPISLGVIFDISGSMANKIDKSRDAVVEFFKTANPEDEFFLVTFSEKPEVLADFTTSIEDIQSKLVYANPKGRTALLDAIYLGMNRMHKAKHQKKALLIISDGGDNHSRYTEAEIKSMVKEADVQIYAIGLYDRDFKTAEEREGPQLLSEISDVTGGRTFTIGNTNELADVATKIGIELRNQYVLGYRPSNPSKDGKWRKIKVKLNPPKGLPPLHVYAKTGYYAPTE